MTVHDQGHRQVSELLGAFALDAVDPDEAAAVQEHLDECRRCRSEVDQLREVAAAVGNASARPSEILWDQIAERLHARVPTPPSIERVAPELAPGDGKAGATLGVSAGSRRLPARLDPHQAGPGRGKNRVRPTWAVVWVGAAAACAALAAVFGFGWSNASGRAGQLQSALARQGASAEVDAALASPGHRIVELRTTKGAQVAELVVRRNGTGYVVASRMAALPRSETYQLWAEIADRPISLGLLGRKPGPGDAFSLATSLRRVRELMVTVEPSAGAVAPDVAPIARAALS